MESFRVLQLGDVHFSERENNIAAVDAKDASLPKALGTAVGIAPLQTATREVARVLGRPAYIHKIAFMGDFTTRGDPIELDTCLTFLARILPARWISNIQADACLCIGNHDIDRKNHTEAAARFGAVNSALAKAGFPQAAVSDPKIIEWSGTLGGVDLLSVNSSVGCGETRFLPSVIKPHVTEEITKIAAGSSSPEILNELIESIDTPAIEEHALSEVTNRIAGLPPNTIPVLCAHHNLLPQTTPRLAPYAELLNGGSIRTNLLMLNRPMIYLHGHIHDDPIETIRSATRPNSGIVSISAPLLRDGFNVVEVFFNDEGGALGVRVHPYRRVGNLIEARSQIDVPLLSAAAGFCAASHRSRHILDGLKQGQETYFSDMIAKVGFQPDELESGIEELRWLSLVRVVNPQAAPKHWRVARVI